MTRPSPHSFSNSLEARGFTLIELIVVITIIGVLLAVAVPRFVSVQRDARVAKAQVVYSLVRSASIMAHSRCMLDLSTRGRREKNSLNCANTPPLIDMEGSPVRIVNRYPAASADGIDSAAAFSSVADGLVIGGSGSGTPERTFDVVGGTVPNCRVIYREARISGSMIVAPVVSLVTSGC